MKRRILSAFVCLAFFFTGCGGSTSTGSGGGGGTEEPPKTTVQFRNDNPFDVSIYQSESRYVKITTVGKAGSSQEIEAEESQSVQYFPTYHIPIDGILFDYKGQVIITRIDRDKTNPVKIPLVSEKNSSEKNKAITSDVYLKIENRSDHSITLNHNHIEMTPFGMTGTIVTHGETVYYVLTAGPVEGFQFMKNTTDPIPFPDDISSFQSGYFYSFSYTGSALTKKTEKLICIDSALAEIAPVPYVSQVKEDSIEISWDKVTNAAGYNVYRSLNEAGPYTKINSTTETRYSDTGLSNNTTYYYKISEVNAGRESELSGYVSGTTLPETPTGVSATGASSTSIAITWNTVSGATYKVYRSPTVDGTYTSIGTSTSNSYTDAGLTNGTTYYYKVSAVNAGGESELSGHISATTYTASGHVAVTIKPADPSLDVSSPIVVIPKGTTGTFSLSGTYSSYQWYLNGKPIPGETADSYTLQSGAGLTETIGIYELSVVVTSGQTKLSGRCQITITN